MCAHHNIKKRKQLSTSMLYLIAVILGIGCGLSGISLLESVGLVLSDIFIKMFKCISLPLISLSIMVTVCQYTSEGGMKQIWQRTLAYTIGTTLVAAFVAFLLYWVISPENIVAQHAAGLDAQKAVKDVSYLSYLVQMIPGNIFEPFLEHRVMGVLLVSLVVGIAIRSIPDESSRLTMTNFLKGAHGMFLVVTGWIVKIIPLGLFGFIVATIVELRSGMDMRGLGEYLAIVVLANLIQGFVILPAWLSFNSIRPFVAMRGMLPALSVAFFSKSSAATLPITMETAEKNLRVSQSISRFVLPLCTSINMNGCAAFIFVTVIYLMQNHGMDISLMTMLSWIVIATVAAIGNAGVPMGCFFLSASLLTSMDVPITLLGLILPFYSIIDMIETALNVWSDSCVAKVVDEKQTALRASLTA